jgi:hypothetical protein
MSNLGKILTNKFVNGGNKITLMPICKHTDRIKKLNIEFKLLND